jgi:hypothetical protein
MKGIQNLIFKQLFKRKRNCYRIDEEQMNVEITRGRSDIYDILTHLTFIFIESHKIRNRVLLDDAGEVSRDWMKLQPFLSKKIDTCRKRESDLTLRISLGGLLRRCWISMMLLHQIPPGSFYVIFWLGKLAIEETIDNDKRTITFSPILRERLGHHIHEIWATNIKES